MMYVNIYIVLYCEIAGRTGSPSFRVQNPDLGDICVCYVLIVDTRAYSDNPRASYTYTYILQKFPKVYTQRSNPDYIRYVR
jgi:hypothetical protein